MKRAAVIILALVVSLVFWVNYNNNPGRIVDRLISSCGLKEGALVYRIELFGFIPVGDALFQQPKEEKLDSVKVYHLSVNAKSLKIVSPFLNGSAEFDSYVDKESGNPVLFRQKISLKGRGELVREAAYDQANRIMTIGGVRREILPDTQDNLSVIFKVRRSVPDKLKDFDFSINTNQKNYMLKGGSSEGVLALKGAAQPAADAKPEEKVEAKVEAKAEEKKEKKEEAKEAK